MRTPCSFRHFVSTALALVALTVTSPGALAPVALRCEYLVNPLAVDEAQPRLTWRVESPERGQRQAFYQVLVASKETLLRQGRGDLWDSGKVASDQTANIPYAGRTLASRQQCWWQVRVWDPEGRSSWSRPAFFQIGLRETTDWQAQWIGDRAELPPVIKPADGKGPERYDAQPVTMLRKEFRLAATPQRAILYASALGAYEFRLNGRRVGDHILAPEWTDYHTRVQYQAYDVTSLLRRGDNALGALLGDGWYAGRLGMSDALFKKLRGVYGRKPYLIAQLDIELANGEKLTVTTDGSWVSTKDGPIRSSDILDGEVYDARRELPGWDEPGFASGDSWQPVGVLSPVPARVVAQPNEPIRVVEELKPVALAEPKPGVYVFDLGQNMVGWCRLELSAPAGTIVTLRHAEMTNEDGTIYTANLRDAPQVDRYTARGNGPEVFEPHFTYHGFRFVEVTGLPRKPKPGALTGRVFCSASPETGQFTCSNPMLNRLWQNIRWTQRANLMSVPTDCPQRDERLGWMGDIQAFAQTACYGMDLAAFLKKWIPDVRDAQATDGRYGDFSPHPYDSNARFSGVPAWGDAGVIVPWRAWLNYGDTRLLAEHLDSMKRWIEYIHARNPDLIWRTGRGNDYNDWLNADTLKLAGWPTKGGEVPKEVFATIYFAHSTELVAKMARIVGRTEDADRYAKLADDIKAAFAKQFVQPDGRLPGDTQAGYALAVHFGLMPEGLRQQAMAHLIEGIGRYHQHLATGFLSTRCAMLELSRRGHTDLAWQLLTADTFPSWGYMIANGTTTMWERWDGYVQGRGFQDPGMNSFNHWAFGSVGEWMVQNILGIQPEEPHPGWSHFTIRPRPGGGVTWAKGHYDSIRGRIASEWTWSGTARRSGFELAVTVPANTTATVYIPAAGATQVTESGQPLAKARGVQFLRLEAGHVVVAVESGNYRFAVKP